MSGNSTTDVVKRLSYGQLSAQRQTEFSEAQAVSHALSNPSLEALKRSVAPPPSLRGGTYMMETRVLRVALGRVEIRVALGYWRRSGKCDG